MTAMKKAAVLASGLLAGSTAFAAASLPVTVSAEAPTRAPGLSRAEVLADLRVWRASGMEVFSRSDSYDWTSAEYEKAYARYLAIRSSDEFKVLVQRIEADPTTEVALRD